MKNAKLNIALLVVFYLIFMLANTPAAMVFSYLPLPPTIKVGLAHGSIWDGKVDALRVNQDVLTNVSWQLSPMALLAGRLAAQVSFGKVRDSQSISGSGYVSVNFAMDQYRADHFTLRYPADQLVKKLALPLPLAVAGKVNVMVDEFDSASPYCEVLIGSITWSKASVKGLQGDIGLGNLEGDLACNKGEIELKVTKDNPLGLNITSLLGANNKFSVKGFVKPNGTMPNEVHQGVKLLGNADSEGRYVINL